MSSSRMSSVGKKRHSLGRPAILRVQKIETNKYDYTVFPSSWLPFLCNAHTFRRKVPEIG